MISDNYFRSVSGLPPALYPECQPSQTALEQNSPNNLTSLVNNEVNSILRILEKPDMYADGNAMSSQSTPRTPPTNESEKDTFILPIEASAAHNVKSAYPSIGVEEGSLAAGKENNPSPGFRPISRPAANNQVKESPQVTHSQGMALLETQTTPGQTIH